MQKAMPFVLLVTEGTLVIYERNLICLIVFIVFMSRIVFIRRSGFPRTYGYYFGFANKLDEHADVEKSLNNCKYFRFAKMWS